MNSVKKYKDINVLSVDQSQGREYELVLGSEFGVFYGFCISAFLKNKLISNEKKYVILNTILHENNIAVLFGDDENYFEILNAWFNNSL